MSKTQAPWIENGYQTFAEAGPNGLKIERLARLVGKNKSSFYHLFADLDVFTATLLEHHLEQARIIAAKEAACTTLEEFIDVLVDHKTDLLFNRQLRVHRQRPEFQRCFMKTNEVFLASLTDLWPALLELPQNTQLAGLILKLSLENFYLQITEETLNQRWLKDYFYELRTLTRAFKNAQHELPLDGTV